MKTVNEYCLFILNSSTLEDKLTPPPEDLIDTPDETILVPEKPNREIKLAFSDHKNKMPRLEHLNQTVNRAIAMHHFANHELMATELFAHALLRFQNIGDAFRKDILRTLADEQKHLRLYLNRMREFGMDLGDIPLNYIFWKYVPLMKTFEKFYAIMSVSFEGANLDYATIYQKTFENHGDSKSAEIMEIIFRDELKHVKRGFKVIEARPDKTKSEWEYFRSLLDHPFTPRRAKGYFYIPDSRRKVGFSEDFVMNLAEYRDEFSNRKKEVIPEEIKTWGVYSG